MRVAIFNGAGTPVTIEDRPEAPEFRPSLFAESGMATLH